MNGAVVVVKWSACSPSTLTIRVRIPLKSTINCLKRTKINKKRSRMVHFYNNADDWIQTELSEYEDGI